MSDHAAAAARMEQLIRTFPDQLSQALGLGQALQLKNVKNDIRNVTLVGLGGSAFGGEVVRNLLFSTCPVPYLIYRGYETPQYLSKHSLVLLSSYSGNTEETLTAAEAAQAAGAEIVAITSGGKLADWARAHGKAVFELPGGYPPRTAAGFSLVAQLFILKHYGLAPDLTPHVQESIALLKAFSDQLHTKELAYMLAGRTTILYTSDVIEAVAIRWRQQINENGKQLCWHHVIPEMNHNELVGWQHPEFMISQATVVLLRTAYEHPRNAYRFDLNEELFRQKGARTFTLQAQGQSLMAQMMYLMHYSDWVSLYLAEANDVDPVAVQVIDQLKGALAAK